MILIADKNRHLICFPYSVENLHNMADRLNINRCWFHGGKYPHYDIPKSRIDEILGKSLVVSSRILLGIIYYAKRYDFQESK